MIGFKGLSKHVGDAWQALDPSAKVKYENMFERDKIRYNSELEEWNKKKL